MNQPPIVINNASPKSMTCDQEGSLSLGKRTDKHRRKLTLKFYEFFGGPVLNSTRTRKCFTPVDQSEGHFFWKTYYKGEGVKDFSPITFPKFKEEFGTATKGTNIRYKEYGPCWRG